MRMKKEKKQRQGEIRTVWIPEPQLNNECDEWRFLLCGFLKGFKVKSSKRRK